MSHAAASVTRAIDEAKLTGFQIGVFVLCALIATLDGFDIGSIGYAAASMAAEFHLHKPALGPIFSAGIFGSMLGALGISTVADCYGRRPLLITATVLFAIFTLAIPWAASFSQLVALRFLIGLGLGGAVPVLIALCSEYAPLRMRATVITLVFCGVPLGGFLGGVAASWLIPHLGWRSIFYLGGTVPVLLAVFAWLWLPESIPFLMDHRKEGNARQMLARISSASVPPTMPPAATTPPQRANVLALLRGGQALRTLLIWLAFFAVLTILNTMITWGPPLLIGTGLSIAAAALIMAGNNLGSITAHLVTGRMIDRLGAHGVLLANFAMGAVFFVIAGQVHGEAAETIILFLAGYCMGSLSSGLTALAASVYPPAIRSTGIGWATGMGRFGGVLGPLIVAGLIGLGWSSAAVLASLALPMAVGAGAIFLLEQKNRAGTA